MLINQEEKLNLKTDSEVEKWMSTYKNLQDLASDLPSGLYLIAQAYSGNKKDAQAQPLLEYTAKTYPKNVYGILSQVRIDANKGQFRCG
jgi:hypothetical protein